MRKIDRYFVGTGIALALVGLTLGIIMGIAQDFTYAPVHAHLNLVGWVTLVLFGFGYRMDVARNDAWAVFHYVVATAGAVIFPIGIYISMTRQQEPIVIVGALLTLGSMLLFAVNFLRARR
jgi:hypothetical protein